MNQQNTLLDVVDRLTIEHPYRAIIEGKSRWVRRDPLIKLLREMIASSLTGGNGTASDASRVPFDADTLEQYDKLDGLILENLKELNGSPHLTPEQNLRAWYTAHNALNPTDEDTEHWRKVWASWETKIEAKLAPPVVLELIDTKTGQPFECPDCGMGWYTQILNSGPDGKGARWYEREKRIALTASYRPDGNGGLERSAVECGCCNWRVTGSGGVRGFAWDLEAGADSNGSTTLVT